MKICCCLKTFFGSSLGKKYIMAVTGVALVLFVTGHLAGNLQIFLPPEAINRYAHLLQSNVELLWPVRIVMLTCLGLHIWSAIRLSLENKAARPVGYHGSPAPLAASYASRTMIMSGLIVAAFIIYHLLHFTVRTQAINLTGVDFRTLKDAAGNPDVYAMVVYGFQQWPVSLFYVIAIGLLCLHLSHAIQAMFQSLGFKNHYYGPMIDKASRLIALALFIGYCAIPVGVLLGVGREYTAKALQQAKPRSDATVGQSCLFAHYSAWAATVAGKRLV